MSEKSSIRQPVWVPRVLAAQKASVCRRCAASVRDDACVPPDTCSHRSRRSEIKAIKRGRIRPQVGVEPFGQDSKLRNSLRLAAVACTAERQERRWIRLAHRGSLQSAACSESCHCWLTRSGRSLSLKGCPLLADNPLNNYQLHRAHLETSIDAEQPGRRYHSELLG